MFAVSVRGGREVDSGRGGLRRWPVEGLGGGEVDINISISRAKFESVSQKLFARCLDTVKQVLRDAKVTESTVADVVLVGGSTCLPRAQLLNLHRFILAH